MLLSIDPTVAKWSCTAHCPQLRHQETRRCLPPTWHFCAEMLAPANYSSRTSSYQHEARLRVGKTVAKNIPFVWSAVKSGSWVVQVVFVLRSLACRLSLAVDCAHVTSGLAGHRTPWAVLIRGTQARRRFLRIPTSFLCTTIAANKRRL